MRITVVGSGYVGLVAGACFAELGHTVVLVDNDSAKVQELRRGTVPIHEKFLPELLARNLGTRLTVSESLGEAVAGSEVIFVAVGTPPTVHGEADLSYIESVAREISKHIDSYKVVVEKSTVPVYTSEWIRKVMLLNGAPADMFDVISNPEFLREGTAVTDFLYPDRIVVGADTRRAAEALEKIYQPLVSGNYAERGDAIPAHQRHSRQVDRDQREERGADQACVERLSGNEDLIHQRGGQCLRVGGRECAAGMRRHRLGLTHR